MKRRGSPPAGARLDRARVIGRAVAMIDEEGLGSFSLRRLAADLGIQPAALYNHVRDRDDLLDEVSERFMAGFEVPPTDLPWTEWLREAAHAFRRRFLAHPHLTDLALARPAAVPAARELVAKFIRFLEGAGFAPDAALGACQAVQTALLGTAQQERAWGVDRSMEFQFLIDVIVEGLASRSPTPPSRRGGRLRGR